MGIFSLRRPFLVSLRFNFLARGSLLRRHAMLRIAQVHVGMSLPVALLEEDH